MPVGFLLKWVGLPIIMVLGALAVPVLLLLAVIGLPFIVVLFFGSVLLTITGPVLAFGIAAAKVLIPVVLLFLVVRWFWRSRTVSTDAAPNATPRS